METAMTRETGKPKEAQIKSIQDALSILNQAAKESSSDVRNSLSKDLKKIREAFLDPSSESFSTLQEWRDASIESLLKARDKVAQSAKDAAVQVDKTAHESPWYFVGGAALVASLMGFYVGKKIH